MATTLKQGGSLFQTSEEEANKLRPQQQPMSPAGAAAQGATPDAAKMTGTPAQKTAALRTPASPPAQDYQRTTRITPPTPQGPDAAAKAAAEKADRLKNMSSIDAQVQGMIEQRMATMQQQQYANMQVDETALAQVDEAQRAGVRSALDAFRNAPDEATRQIALQQLQNATGNAALTPEGVSAYFQGGPEAFRATTQAVLPENIKLGMLPQFSQQYDINQLSADLGKTPEEIQDMTLEQLQQAVQDEEARGYNRMQEIDARLMSATGAERQALINEKRQLTAMGVTGVEAAIDRLQQSITAASTVRVAGQDLALQDILSDDALSDLIVNAAGDDKTLAAMKLRPETQGLAEWIELNKKNLQDIGVSYRTTTRGYMDVQKQAADAIAATGASDELFKKVMGPKPANFTAEQWAAYQTQMQDNPIFQAMSEDPYLKGKLNLPGVDVAALQGLSKEDIKSIGAASKLLEEDADIASLLGLTPGTLITPDKLDDVQAASQIKGTLGEQAAIMTDPLFKKEFADNNITVEIAAQLAADPTLWGEIKQADIDRKAWEKSNPQTPDDVLKFLSTEGQPPMTLESVNKAMSNLRTLASLGDKGAEDVLAQMTRYFDGNKDGKFDAADMGFMQKLVQEASGDLASIAQGNESFTDFMNKIKGAVGASGYVSSDMTARNIAGYVEDGKLDVEEIKGMSDAELEIMISNPAFKTYAGALSIEKSWRAYEVVEKNYKKAMSDVTDKIIPELMGSIGDRFENLRIVNGKFTANDLASTKTFTLQEHGKMRASLIATKNKMKNMIGRFSKGTPQHAKLMALYDSLDSLLARVQLSIDIANKNKKRNTISGGRTSTGAYL